jgi:hypothetical protein
VGRNGGVLSSGVVTATRIHRCGWRHEDRSGVPLKKAAIVEAVVDASEKPADPEELRV